MKRRIIQTTIICILFLFALNKINAQVTIGSGVPAAKGAILEIKSKEADNNNITSDKGGLGLPRVMLRDRTTLEPFISTTDHDWTNKGNTKIDRKHTGLIVYNLYESPSSVKDYNKIFHKGVYIWDGEKWNIESFNQKRYFYLPTFNIPLKETGTKKTFNLYEEYKKQFTKTLNNKFISNNKNINTIPSPMYGRLYSKEELNYVITYFDDKILDNIVVDNDGLMTYDVKSINTTPDSYINVLFIVK